MDPRDRLGLAAVVGALVILYFVSGSPIALYSMWQDELGLTHADMSLASMWYLFGTVVPLLFMSRISDHLGRRPATVLILLVALCGAVTFAMVESPAMIQAGRLIQGVASGLGSSTVAAYVVDLSAGLPKWVGPTITSSAPNVGLALGAFAAGGAVTFTGVGTDAYFEGAAVAIAVIAVLVVFARETVPRSPGLLRSLVPRLVLPRGCLRIYAASAMVFVATWAVGGFSQSFSSVIVSETTGSENSFLSAAVYVTLLLPVVVGSFFSGRFDTRQAQRRGMGAYVLCLVLMYVTLFVFGSLLWFCVFSVLAGIAQGVAFTAGVSALVGRASKEERAGTFSTIYLTSYGGAAVPSLLVGLFGGGCSTGDIMLAYVVLVAAMYAVLLALTAPSAGRAVGAEARA